MRRLTSAALGVALLVAGCGTPLARPRAGESPEIVEMKSRILELQRKLTVTEVEVARLRRQVAELEARLGSGAETAAPVRGGPLAEAPAERDPLPVPVTPAPPVEVDDLEPAGEAPPPSPDAEAPRTDSPAPVSDVAQALYDRGYTLYHQGRYLDAENSFQRFLQSFAETELADNAQYWIGEARLARGDTRGALAAFRETVERFPDGNKVPDALLKSGDCLAELGDVEGARSRYREVGSRFPETAAAAMADERLARLP